MCEAGKKERRKKEERKKGRKATRKMGGNL